MLVLQGSAQVQAFMNRTGLKDVAALEAYFEERVLGLASAAGRSYIIWQDVVDNGVKARQTPQSAARQPLACDCRRAMCLASGMRLRGRVQSCV